MSLRAAPLAVVVALVLGAGPALAEDARARTRSLLVLGVKGPEALRRPLADALALSIARDRRLAVISSEDVRRLLEMEANRRLVGCDDSDCAGELVGALGADLVVFSELAELSGELLWSAVLVDKDGKVLARHREEASGADALSARSNAVADALLDDFFRDIALTSAAPEERRAILERDFAAQAVRLREPNLGEPGWAWLASQRWPIAERAGTKESLPDPEVFRALDRPDLYEQATSLNLWRALALGGAGVGAAGLFVGLAGYGLATAGSGAVLGFYVVGGLVAGVGVLMVGVVAAAFIPLHPVDRGELEALVADHNRRARERAGLPLDDDAE